MNRDWEFRAVVYGRRALGKLCLPEVFIHMGRRDCLEIYT